jgi:hypothetical protein
VVEQELTVETADADDAHRALERGHSLAVSLSYVEQRQVRADYTLRWDSKRYQIDRRAITAGLRGANVRVEERLDGTLAVRHGARYLPVEECAVADKPKTGAAAKPAKKPRVYRRGVEWKESFERIKAPKIWQAMRDQGTRRREPDERETR